MTLDFDTCYRAVLARDPRFDGRFFTGVTSTGIYCRPVCPARTPARANMRFFRHPGAAEAAGFRACRRCRPETSPGSPEWNARADLAARAVRLISAGYVDEHGIGGLAGRLAVTERHLHRLLVAELGTGPLALARTVRLQTARRLLAETSLPITDIAFASGFSSVRQFNATVLESSGRTPSQLRAAARGAARRESEAADGPGTWLTLRLACREPYDAAALLDFLAVRAVPGVEQVTAGGYSRTVRTAGGAGLIELLPRPGQGHVLLRARLGKLGGVGPLVSRCRRLLDADADPAAIGTALAADDLIAPLVRARPGLRVPGCYDGFELAVRAVLGQQVSVAAARTFAARLAARHGTPLPAGMRPDGAPAGTAADGPAAGQPGPHLLFPGPEELAGADLTGLGLTEGRRRTLDALAAAAASARLDLSLGADPEETAARLAELPGIGPWTISYIMLRTGADPDAFPATDLGLRRALARLGAPPGHPGRWRPWRGYAAQHLWTWAAAAAAAAAAGTAAATAATATTTATMATATRTTATTATAAAEPPAQPDHHDYPAQPARPPGTRRMAAGRDGRSAGRVSVTSPRGADDA
jgi:AraC family transcriptional regulator of adaptative response / DNA-3-methyladenine glycosylase II